MIDFSFSLEQETFRKTLERFALKELAPKYTYWDRKREFPLEQVRKMADLGLFGLNIPAEYGGQPTDFITIGIAMEEIARGDFNCVVIMMLAVLAAEMIDKYGSEEQKATWLPVIARADKIFALGATEPGAGSDLARLQTKAVRDGDDYILNGEKNSVTLSNADAFLIMARTESSSSLSRGISLFIVPRETSGVTTSEYNDLGCRSIPRGPVVMTDARIPRGNLIGQEGQGFKIVLSWIDYNRVYIGLKCLSAARVALEEVVQHAKTRVAFGKPLARFEGISFPIAEAATKLEAARWLCYRALWLKQQGLPMTKEAAMVKWWAPQISTEIIHQALLHHGHYGYSDEFPLEQRLRDVMGWQIGDGSVEVQKIIIAREIMGRDFLPY